MRRLMKRCGKLPCTVFVALAILLALSNTANAQFHIYNGAGVGYDYSVVGYGGLYGYPPMGSGYGGVSYGYPGFDSGSISVSYSYPGYGISSFSSGFQGWSYGYPAANFHFAYPGWGYGYSAPSYASYGVYGYPGFGYGYSGVYSR
jgi:hypothetical protein